MLPFQLTVNGKQHQVKQDKFKESLVDCPKEVAQRQIELGNGVWAVTNAYHTVLVPIAVDVHRFVFVRTPTQSVKAAEVKVLLGEKERDTDLFVLKSDKETIAELQAKLAKLESEKSQEPKEVVDHDTEDEEDAQDPDVTDSEYDPEDLEDLVINEADQGYTLEELGKLGPAGLINLILEKDETFIEEDLAKKNMNDLVTIYNDLCDEEELDQIKGVK